jgi:hypothetical protein
MTDGTAPEEGNKKRRLSQLKPKLRKKIKQEKAEELTAEEKQRRNEQKRRRVSSSRIHISSSSTAQVELCTAPSA